MEIRFFILQRFLEYNQFYEIRPGVAELKLRRYRELCNLLKTRGSL